jgi:hypothetical protein
VTNPESTLHNKYRIEKTDGTPVDPNAQYFVLRPDKDPLARKAIRTYARGLTAPEDQTFKQQLLAWVTDLSAKASNKNSEEEQLYARQQE